MREDRDAVRQVAHQGEEEEEEREAVAGLVAVILDDLRDARAGVRLAYDKISGEGKDIYNGEGDGRLEEGG